MWTQTYLPIGGSLTYSALAAMLPVFMLLFLLGVLRTSSWVAAVSGFATALFVALAVYGMPVSLAFSTTLYGAAYGILPIGWIVFTAVLLYRITVETGQFEIIKNSLSGLTGDQRLQVLLIAFAFAAFIEGAAGFGTPVAIAAAMLTGLGFRPFQAAAICLLANTAPVAFGSLGTPLVMLQAVTKLPMESLSANVGRLCAPISLILPSYLMLVMGGLPALKAVWPAALLSGIAFGGTQFLVSSYLGPYLTDILGAIVAMITLVALLQVWKPADAPDTTLKHGHTGGEVLRAWMPYLFLVMFVLVWGYAPTKAILDKFTIAFGWPGLHNIVVRVPPITTAPAPYGAMYNLNLLSASGTSCLFAVIVSSIFLRLRPGKLLQLAGSTLKQLVLPLVTIMSVLALAFLMNYSGATATLGLVAASTGAAFPFFSVFLGWLGVFLTGSDTSANALFGSLQEVTAGRLGFSPSLMASANSAGGVLGKMISVQSIAVAAAATGLPKSEEANLLRFTLKHSVTLTVVMGLIALFYAYVMPSWVR